MRKEEDANTMELLAGSLYLKSDDKLNLVFVGENGKRLFQRDPFDVSM